MSVRDTYLKDYGLSEEDVGKIIAYCRKAKGYEQRLLLEAAPPGREARDKGRGNYLHNRNDYGRRTRQKDREKNQSESRWGI